MDDVNIGANPEQQQKIIKTQNMVVLARQNGQLKKEIKKWKKDFQKPISD
jgi:hypothetical protein